MLISVLDSTLVLCQYTGHYTAYHTLVTISEL